MGLFSKFKSPSTRFKLNPCGGDVLTLQSKYGTYLTACEDKTRVTLEEKLPLPGSNNRQCWTVVRYRVTPNNPADDCYFLKSIYGTFLARRCGRYCDDVCQTHCPAEDSPIDKFPNIYDLLWELNCVGHSDSPVDWFSLDHYSFPKCHPKEDGSLKMDNNTCMSWLVRLVDWDKNTMIVGGQPRQNTPTSAPIPSATTPPAVAPNHPSPPPNYEHSQKSDKPKVVSINFNNQLGSNSAPGGPCPSSLYNAGQNVNGSGTQKNGDVDVRNQAGRYEHLYFQFQ